MTYRKLRIAWSVAWGMVAVLLCVLWARSYWWATNIQTPPVGSWAFQCALTPGRTILLRAIRLRTATVRQEWIAVFENHYRYEAAFNAWAEPVVSDFEFSTHDDWFPGSIYVTFPYWFALIIVGGASLVPWLPIKRFSLRTLLIATTLVAVVLGAVVYAGK